MQLADSSWFRKKLAFSSIFLSLIKISSDGFIVLICQVLGVIKFKVESMTTLISFQIESELFIILSSFNIAISFW